MAPSCQPLALKLEALARPQIRGLQLSRRHSHSRSLWEELLGRKLEPAAAKKVEEAFLEYRVRKAVPSWLPFLPNSSFWMQSTEETIKNLEVLAERMKVSRPVTKERLNILKPPPDWSETPFSGTLSTPAAWSAIHSTDKFRTPTTWSAFPSADALLKSAVWSETTSAEKDPSFEEEEEEEEEEDLVVEEGKKPEDKGC